MILCGMLCDRLGAGARTARSAWPSAAWAVACCCHAFALPTGTAQLVLIGLGMMVAAGTTGPSSAMVANLTHASVHGTAFATLTLANNLLGLATGPLLTGRLSDLIGLHAPSSWCR
jgi:MFS family permease